MNGITLPVSLLADAALSGSVVILLLLFLRPLLRRWLGARVVHALWLVALVRLLVPWTPHTPMAVLPAQPQGRVAPASFTIRSYVLDGAPEPAQALPAPLREEPSHSLRSFAAAITRWVWLAWLIGAAGVFGLSLTGALRAAPLVRRARELASDSAAMRLLASLPLSVRPLRILETDELKSPALCGFLRPVILLPPGWADDLTPEELRCVLLHEIGHHRRGDVLWRWAFLFARAVHWFNPLVWLAEREMRADQEMACDEWVLAHAGGIDAQTYGSVLLRACRNLIPPRIGSPGHATMAESSTGLAQRIRHLARTKPHGWRAFAIAAVLGGLFLGIGPARTGAQQASPSLDATLAKPVTPPPDSSTAPFPAPASTPAPATAAKAEVQKILIESRMLEARFSQDSGKAREALEKALFGGGANSSPQQVQSILEDDQLQAMIRFANQKKGMDLLTAPKVTCNAGQRAVVEVIREFRYPTEFEPGNSGSGQAVPTAFETRNTGVTLELLPAVKPGNRIEMVIIPSVVEFEGFVNYGAGRPARKSLQGDALTELMKNPSTRHIINQPIFSTRKINTAASIKSGQTVLVGGLSRTDTQMVDETVKSISAKSGFWRDQMGSKGEKGAAVKRTYEQKVDTYLYIFVTARILAAGEPAPPAGPVHLTIPPPPPASTPAPSAGMMDLLDRPTPAALPVPNKPGFVISPYAPKLGCVDVRGFPSGTEVKCPYTGKTFVIP